MREPRLYPIMTAACVFALSACQPTVPDTAPEISREGDRVVARVDDSAIYASDVRRAAEAQGLIGPSESLSPETDAFARTLDGLIDQRLLARHALSEGLLQDDEAARRLASARERILGNLAVERMLERAVTEDSLRELYEAQNRLAAAGPERRLRQIVVADADAAESVIERLEDGEDFEELAKELSTDRASSARGGEIGWTTRGALPAALRGPAFALATGARTKPIETPAGFHIIELLDRRSNEAGGPSFDEVREDLARFMTLETVEDMMRDLREDADIVRGEALPDADTDTQESPE